MWAERLGVKSLTSVFLLDCAGRPCASVVGILNGTPDELVATFIAMYDVRKRRDAAFAPAAKESGVAKANELAKGLADFGEHAGSGYLETIEQIVLHDPDNFAGLRARFLPVVRACYALSQFASRASMTIAKATKCIPRSVDASRS
jgi:hypothetical protein